VSRGKYLCQGYLALSPVKSGLLYPIFKTGSLNWSFVQESDRLGNISFFIPFFEFEEFGYVPTSSSISCSLGDESIFAYLNSDNKLVELSYSDAQRLGREGGDIFEDKRLPTLTRLALARLANAPQLVQLGVAKEFSDRFLTTPLSKELFRSTYSNLIEERRRIWQKVEFTEAENTRHRGLQGHLRGIEREDLFRWLFSNPYSEAWVLGFAKLLRQVGFDERIFDLLVDMLTSDEFGWGHASPIEKAIVARGVETYAALREGHSDFEDVMEDYATSGWLFDLLDDLSAESIVEFISLLDCRGRLASPVIDIYLDALERDDLSSELAYSLLDEAIQSAHLDVPYPSPDPVFHETFTRRDRLLWLVNEAPRLALVVSLYDRSRLKKILKRKS
jgi:hypothetical protein